MAKKNRRFTEVYKDSGMMTETKVLVDRKTGVNYLFHLSGYGGGLTPLLDRDGKPVITTVWEGMDE